MHLETIMIYVCIANSIIIIIHTAANSEARISCCDFWYDDDYCVETVEAQAACKKAVLANLMLQGTINNIHVLCIMTYSHMYAV